MAKKKHPPFDRETIIKDLHRDFEKNLQVADLVILPQGEDWMEGHHRRIPFKHLTVGETKVLYDLLSDELAKRKSDENRS